MSNTCKWYQSISNTLSDILIELRGKGIGKIPFENLIHVPDLVDKRELSSLIADDGIPALYWKFTSVPGDDDVIVVVK